MSALAAVFVGAVLIGSGAGKLSARGAIVAFLKGLGVPRRMRTPVTLVLGVAETGLGVSLIFGVAPRWSSVAAAVLALGFLAAHALAWFRGSSASCRCFGALDTDLDPAISAVRAAVLFAAAAALAIAWQSGQAPAGAPGAQSVPLLGGLMASLSYLLIFGLVNETVILVRRDRDIDQNLRAAATRLEGAAAQQRSEA